jgi:hypothetical protein
MNDYQLQHGSTLTCCDCGRLFTDSDGGCSCGRCKICDCLVQEASDWVWEDVVICEQCQDIHRDALDIAEKVIVTLKGRLKK